jgi:hypothetical protein
MENPLRNSWGEGPVGGRAFGGGQRAIEGPVQKLEVIDIYFC